MQRVIIGAVAAAVLASLAGCDSGAKAVAQGNNQDVERRAERSYGEGPATASRESRLDKVAWAASKSRSAASAAQAQFEKNGKDFNAASLEDYVTEAHAFAKRPPKGTEMATRRNGDVLLYDGASNTFAVVTAEGLPRTLFKPRDGAKYWAEQKASAGEQTKRASRQGPAEG